VAGRLGSGPVFLGFSGFSEHTYDAVCRSKPRNQGGMDDAISPLPHDPRPSPAPGWWPAWTPAVKGTPPVLTHLPGAPP